MLKDSSIIENRHQKFVERSVKSGRVWALKSNEGFAVCPSTEYDDTNVLLFWSDKAYAKAVAKDEWEKYEPEEMPLSDFLEFWLVGMHSDNALAGTNFDTHLFGKENEPLGLALEFVSEIAKQKDTLNFSNYKDLSDFEMQVRNALEE